jgi:hypothetical protein
MTIASWIVSLVLLGSWILVVSLNLWITFGGLLRKREKFHSLIPFVGGLIGMVGVLFLPVSGVRHFWWVPLLLDLGCGPMLAAVVVDQIRKAIRPGNKDQPAK